MRVIASSVGFTLARARQPSNGRNTSRVATITHATSTIAMGERFELSLQPRRRRLAALTSIAIGQQRPIGEGRQHVHAAIDANHLSGLRQRCESALAFKASVPAAVASHNPCSSEPRHAEPALSEVEVLAPQPFETRRSAALLRVTRRRGETLGAMASSPLGIDDLPQIAWTATADGRMLSLNRALV